MTLPPVSVTIDGYSLKIIPDTWKRQQTPIAPTWDRWDKSSSKGKRAHGANVGYIDVWTVQAFEDASAVIWNNSAAKHFESHVADGVEVAWSYSFGTDGAIEWIGLPPYNNWVYVLSCEVWYDAALKVRYFALTIRAF